MPTNIIIHLEWMEDFHTILEGVGVTVYERQGNLTCLTEESNIFALILNFTEMPGISALWI